MLARGVGFVVGSTVVDKRKLRSLAVVMYGFLSTVVPLLAVVMNALRTDTAMSTANTTICDVTELQADGIRLLFRNSSCDYNMTVASILTSD